MINGFPNDDISDNVTGIPEDEENTIDAKIAETAAFFWSLKDSKTSGVSLILDVTTAVRDSEWNFFLSLCCPAAETALSRAGLKSDATL